MNANIPTRIGQRVSPNIWNELTEEKQGNIIEAAKTIYGNYLTALKAIDKA